MKNRSAIAGTINKFDSSPKYSQTSDLARWFVKGLAKKKLSPGQPYKNVGITVALEVWFDINCKNINGGWEGIQTQQIGILCSEFKWEL